MPRARLLVIVALGATSLLLTGCAVGQRPTLGEPAELGGAAGTKVGDTAVDGVLALLEGVESNEFTATYDITRKLGPETTTGRVVQNGTDSAVTIGKIAFYRGGDTDQTCNTSTKACTDGIDEAKVSNYSVGSQFYGVSPARALRVTYSRKAGAPNPSVKTFGGVEAQCVTVPVGTGAEEYCATPSGALALWDTAALHVELKTFSQDTDPAELTPPPK